ncbi:MAG: AAA family ATPase [Anaerolineae bacterium]|jgi:ABC-type Mn2+/Zn2+ transport system ATPase subunit|nr:AAA family ATPase [Anaerolineae bacterium]MBT7075108.1 AAA family ATPase [Anaerolineae bacterium]MBT7783025.1 AAA family ATPase [Anaerolineae bacterium]
MSFKLTIPQAEEKTLDIVVDIGECLFVLGANGSGKSSFMHKFYSVNFDNSIRISAHRQTWFASNAVTLSPEQKRATEHNMHNTDRDPESRWKDNYSAQRASIAIYDLIDAENVRARSIARAVDNDDINLARELSQKDAPIKIINNLLRLSNIPVEISVRKNEQVVASKSGCAPYSIAELSDGERNAVLIASKILTAEVGTLILIDEPERHLHRSIISPLLNLLFEQRPDCAFIISTHEVMLPLDNPTASTLLVRDCIYTGTSVSEWDADLIGPECNIDDDLKEEILGARRKILFIEGVEQSLDKSLYSLIFKNVSVIAKSSCRDVEHAVSGIRESSDFHWLNVFGIVDNDRRTQSDIDYLKEKGVYAISEYSVESIYYHPDIQRRVAERHETLTGENASVQLLEAKSAAIDAITPHIQRLSEKAVEKLIRKEFFQHLPNKNKIALGTPIDISIDVASIVAEERDRFQEALDAVDLAIIISRYPIRETPALSEIARRLGFQGRKQYEGAVQKMLMDDEDALAFVKSLFGTLEADIEAE